MKTSLFIVFSLIFLSSCAGGRAMIKNAAPVTASGESSDRMVIKNAYITLETDNQESAVAYFTEMAGRYGGYVVNAGNRSITIRVKASYLSNAIGDMSSVGKVISKNISGQDVTDEYKDMEIRLDNAKKAREKYLELLKKGTTVDEILKVEKELERINTEIDLLQGRINRLAHLTEYATISIELQKKVTPGPLGWIFWGLYEGVKWLFIWE